VKHSVSQGFFLITQKATKPSVICFNEQFSRYTSPKISKNQVNRGNFTNPSLTQTRISLGLHLFSGATPNEAHPEFQ